MPNMTTTEAEAQPPQRSSSKRPPQEKKTRRRGGVKRRAKKEDMAMRKGAPLPSTKHTISQFISKDGDWKCGICGKVNLLTESCQHCRREPVPCIGWWRGTCTDDACASPHFKLLSALPQPKKKEKKKGKHEAPLNSTGSPTSEEKFRSRVKDVKQATTQSEVPPPPPPPLPPKETTSSDGGGGLKSEEESTKRGKRGRNRRRKSNANGDAHTERGAEDSPRILDVKTETPTAMASTTSTTTSKGDRQEDSKPLLPPCPPADVSLASSDPAARSPAPISWAAVAARENLPVQETEDANVEHLYYTDLQPEPETLWTTQLFGAASSELEQVSSLGKISNDVEIGANGGLPLSPSPLPHAAAAAAAAAGNESASASWAKVAASASPVNTRVPPSDDAYVQCASALSHLQVSGDSSPSGTHAWPSIGQDQEDADMAAALQASLRDQEEQYILAGGSTVPAVSSSTDLTGTLETVAGVAASGLVNEAGEYNCFLNSVVQCLWHSMDFRYLVASWPPLLCSADAVVYALKDLFSALAPAQPSLGASDAAHGATSSAAAIGTGTIGTGTVLNNVVDPSALREALASLPGHAFQLHQMADAGEVLLAVIERINAACVTVGAPCLADPIFGLRIAESVTCSACGCTTHSSRFLQYVYTTQATALRLVAEPGQPLGHALRAIDSQSLKTCDVDAGGCGHWNHVTHFIDTNAPPRAFVLQLAWESINEAADDVGATLGALGGESLVDLAHIYQAVQPGILLYGLRSVVAYYGQHYMAFVLLPSSGRRLASSCQDSGAEGEWVMIDDARTVVVGDWNAVVAKCIAGRIQPSLLFYDAAWPGPADVGLLPVPAPSIEVPSPCVPYNLVDLSGQY